MFWVGFAVGFLSFPALALVALYGWVLWLAFRRPPIL